MSSAHEKFGTEILAGLLSKPFGSLSKRELELSLLGAAIDAELLPAEPAQLAANLKLSLTKTNAYLTDLALRRPALTDADAVASLMTLLPTCEVLPDGKHLSIPLHDAALRIWLERKLAAERMHPGESLRRDVVKLTPLGLLRLLDRAEGIKSPAEALGALGDKLGQPDWLNQAKATWTPKTSWSETLSTFGSAVSIIQDLPLLFGVVFGS